MSFKVKSNGSWVAPLGVKVKQAGSWVSAKSAYVKSNGSWVQFWASVPSASVDATEFFGYSQMDMGDAYTDTATITITGGTPPYTCSWSKINGSAMNVTYPASSSTSFYANTNVPAVFIARFGCLITDNAGATCSIVPVTASIEIDSGA